jgi:serine/threonine protein kinase
MSLTPHSSLGKPAALSEFPVAFGRYLLLKRLSRGGMGEIFLAKLGEIKGFEKFVIIKKILPQLAENEDFINRFIDEVQIAIKLHHVNIAQVYEAGTVDKEYFLAIEYIEGRDLRRIIRRCKELGRRLPIDQCVHIARDMAAGLAYAHRRTGPKGQALSLVHCDISPPNLMVSYEGEVKVIDFGSARSAIRTADSNPNIGFGKFGYMAPEQLLRGGVIDRRTDIYAAGVVLYELLTGDRLYQFPEGTDYRAMARAVCQGKFVPPSQKDPAIDSVLDAIVCKALATRPEDRYQFAEEFRDALQQKLYQLNPTISTDTLARTMDDLFQGERHSESEELNQMRAVDAAAYRDELTEAVGHTVTFARALEDGRLPAGPGPAADGDDAKTTAMPQTDGARADGPPGSGPPSVIVSSGALRPAGMTGQAGVVRAQSGAAALSAASGRAGQSMTAAVVPQDPPESSWRTARWGVLAFVLVFLGGGAWWWRSRPMVSSPAGPTRPIPPSEAPTPPQPVVENLPPPAPPPPAPPPPTKPAVVENPPVKKPWRPGLRQRPAQPKVEDTSPAALEKKRLEVDRKFQQVKAEYLDFKKNFGSRLEDRWQQILSDIALGRRDQGLSDALDALRRDMKQTRSKNE